MVAVVLCVVCVYYVEIIVFIVSKFVGFGMCVNIDEFMEIIFRVIEVVGGVVKGKAIIVFNLVELLLMMCDMVYVLSDEVS